VFVENFVLYARLRLGEHEGLENRLDSFVESIGGTRLEGTPWAALLRMLGLRRAALGRTRDVYEIPGGFFRER
jgi:hypothetical protein